MHSGRSDRLSEERQRRPRSGNLDAGASTAGAKNVTPGTVETAEARRFVIQLTTAVAWPSILSASQQWRTATPSPSTRARGLRSTASIRVADPSQNRNATQVALTHHPDDVHLYVDRKTFKAGGIISRMAGCRLRWGSLCERKEKTEARYPGR
jgi:hypothetical protein